MTSTPRTRLARARSGASAALVVSLLLSTSLRAEPPACKEECEKERVRVERSLAACLKEVDPRPPDRAAKMRLLCRERNVPPRCEGLPACKKEPPPKLRPPGMTLGAIVFSSARRGPPLEHPRYAAGTEIHLRVDAEVLARPKASRVWLQLNLRMIALEKKGKTREVARWESYAEEQRMIDPAERGLPLRFTLHGGAQLPADQTPGSYQMEAQILEKVSGFQGTARQGFTVVRKGTR
jgi:hypothetical protein